MHARLEADVLSQRTKNRLLTYTVAHATASAANAPRITRSHKANKALRRAVWMILVIAVYVAVRLS